jgi:hypothetical protein
MKTTTRNALTAARLEELTSIPYVAVEVLDALDRVRKAVQGSGIDGAHESCVTLERIRRAIRRVVVRIDAGTDELVRRDLAGR